MILLILRAPTRTFLKNLFYVIPAFSDFFFWFQTSIHLTTGFLFSFLICFFFTFLTYFLFIWLLCFQKKLQNDTKKRQGLSNDVSLTITFLLLHIHSIRRRGGKVGFIFCFVLRVTLSETFTKTRKKGLRKWLICESFFFSWSHDVVRCCGNCPKYRFSFFVFFSRYKVLWSKHHSSVSRGELLCKCFFDFLIFGKIYNKVWGILLLQLLQKDLRNNHFLTEDMERLRVVV